MKGAFWRGFWEGLNPLFILAWLLFWLGHASSIAMHWRDTERWVGFWFPLYQWAMRASFAVQNRFGFSSPWSDVS